MRKCEVIFARALIIDDDEKLNHLLKRFLKDYGFTVYSGTDADAGLKKV